MLSGTDTRTTQSTRSWRNAGSQPERDWRAGRRRGYRQQASSALEGHRKWSGRRKVPEQGNFTLALYAVPVYLTAIEKRNLKAMTSAPSINQTSEVSRVLASFENHVAHVRLNRPDKMNALDEAMFVGIVAAGEQIKQDVNVRAVVLSGEGRAFCAGLDMGATPFLQKLVGDDVARELTYTNRLILAEEAKELGLVTRVCDNPVEEALKVAGDIASRNPAAIRAAKRLLNKAPYEGAAETLLAESVEQDGIIGSPNQVEAVMANLENREPKFV